MNSIPASPFQEPPKQAIVTPIRIFQEEPESYDAAPQPKRFVIMRSIEDERQIIPTLGAHAFAVYCYLDGYCNVDGVAWPSLDTIIEETQIPRSTVKRSIAKLVDAKWVEIRPRRNKYGRSTSNEYYLPKHQKPLNNGGSNNQPNADQTLTKPDAILDPEVSTSSIQGNTKVNPSESNDARDADPEKSKPKRDSIVNPSGPAQSIVAAWCRAAGVKQPTNYGLDVREAQQLANAGFSPDDISAIVAWMSADSFWRSKSKSLTTIRKTAAMQWKTSRLTAPSPEPAPKQEFPADGGLAAYRERRRREAQ